jgi:hypothetical protein
VKPTSFNPEYQTTTTMATTMTTTNGTLFTLSEIDLDDSYWWEPLIGDWQAVVRIHNEASSLFFDEKLSKSHYCRVCYFMWIQKQLQPQQPRVSVTDNGGHDEDNNSPQNHNNVTARQLWQHLKESYITGLRQEKSMVQWILPDLEKQGTTAHNNHNATAGNTTADRNSRLDLLEDRMQLRYEISSSSTSPSPYRKNGINNNETTTSTTNKNSNIGEEDSATRMTYSACIMEFWKIVYEACDTTSGSTSCTTSSLFSSTDESRPFKRRRTSAISYSTEAFGSTFNDLLKGTYKLPTVYLLISVLKKKLSQMADNSLSWTSVRTSSHAIPSIFKTMTEQDIQAGLALVGLESLQADDGFINGLTIPNLVNEYFANPR